MVSVKTLIERRTEMGSRHGDAIGYIQQVHCDRCDRHYLDDGKKENLLNSGWKRIWSWRNSVLFGIAQFVAWENRFEQMSHSFYDYGPCDALRRGAFLFVLNL